MKMKKVVIGFWGLRLSWLQHLVKLNAVEQKYITEEYIKKTKKFGATLEFYTVP